MSISQIRRLPFTELAAALRLSTSRYKQPQSIRGYLRFCEDNSSRRLIPKIESGGNIPMAMITSWTTFDFMSLDFSKALATELHEDGGKRVQKTKVIFVNSVV
jgi:hypothetical protein